MMNLRAAIQWSFLAAVVAMGLRTAAADTVTLRGSTIPLREVRIEAIRSGELYYFDHNNQLQRRALDEVTALGFDGLAELDDAEKSLAEGDNNTALLKYLQALVKTPAENETQRLWLHARLSRLHNARNEYVPAAGHAAAAFMIESHASWKSLEPTCTPTQPDFAQAREADELLREAARQVQDQTLREVIARMAAIVQPIRAELEKAYNGPPIAQNSTWSGFSRKRIADGAIELKGASAATTPNVGANEKPVAANDSAAESKPSMAPASTPPAAAVQTTDAQAIDRAADEIDALLAAKNFAEALGRCESAGRNVAGRDIARLLRQWGVALQGVGRPEDAAVMFTRCAVLFPGSTDGLESLIETAILYETVYKKPETAKRLLRRVVDQAQLQGREAVAQRARGLLEK